MHDESIHYNWLCTTALAVTEYWFILVGSWQGRSNVISELTNEL